MFALSTLLSLSLLAPAATPIELLEGVHDRYRKAGDIEAKFEQTYVGGLRGKTKQEFGSLWAKQDGRVRWQYEKPEPKFFIFDGKNAYYYEPLNTQVWVYNNFKDSKLANALQLLLGRVNLTKQFDVAACSRHCDLGDGKEVVLELTPKEAMANIDHVALVIDPATKRVAKSAMFDSLGYRTVYRFTDVHFNAKIGDKKFVFKTPAGVQELKAPSLDDGPKAELPNNLEKP